MSSEKDFFARLIRAVRKYPCLYMKDDTGYNNKIIRDGAWHQVAIECNSTPSSCRYRWRLLRERFCKELKKQQLMTPRSKSTGESIKWPYYHEMYFLKSFILPRSTSNVYGEQTNFMPKNEESTSHAVSMFSSHIFTMQPAEASMEAAALGSPDRPCTTVLEKYTHEDYQSKLIANNQPLENKETRNLGDELFMKTIINLMAGLPLAVRDTFQARMYQEIYMLRAQVHAKHPISMPL